MAIFFDDAPEIIESGGMVSSTSPGTKFPGKAKAEVTIRLRVKDPAAVDRARLERVVAAATVPAHIVTKLEVLGLGGTSAAKPPPAKPPTAKPVDDTPSDSSA